MDKTLGAHTLCPEKRGDKHRSIPDVDIIRLGQHRWREVEGLLGLAWRAHLPIIGTSWVGEEQLSGIVPGVARGVPRPTETIAPLPQTALICSGPGRHHGATGHGMLNRSAAAGSEPRLFAVSCLRFIYYSYQAPDKNVRRALISQRNTGKATLMVELGRIL